MKKLKIHPVAEMFPMMPEEELDDLAADIKANGLIHELTLDAEGQLCDGRNRFEACKRAGIEPRFETLNGQDPVAFILSANERRRHMKQGQRAMVAAKIQLFLKNSQSKAAKQAGVSQAQVAYAVIVLEYAPDLANSVVAGIMPLNEAYEEAQKRKKELQSDEAKLSALNKHAPDLASQVAEETLSLAEAVAALNAREEEERAKAKAAREEIQLGTRFFEDALSFLIPNNPERTVENFAAYRLRTIDVRLFTRVECNKKNLRRALEVFQIITQTLAEKKTP